MPSSCRQNQEAHNRGVRDKVQRKVSRNRTDPLTLRRHVARLNRSEESGEAVSEIKAVTRTRQKR